MNELTEQQFLTTKEASGTNQQEALERRRSGM